MKLLSYGVFVFLAAGSLSLEAAYTLKNGKLMNSKDVATLSVQEHYSAAMDALEKKDWEELVHQSTIIYKNFPSSPFSQDAMYYLGIGHFNLKNYDMANKQFSAYLKRQTTPKHFEEAIQYKFSIAEKFKSGAKKHIMGWESMPKWLPAKEEAIAIYDEVITALPHHDLGAQALFGKAKLLLGEEEYKSSIEAYQTLIRRFPRHSLAADSYVGISEIYLTQCQAEYPDPDFLDLAEINLRKFRQDFPREDKIVTAENMVLEMKEFYAKSLYETGQFFERTKKPHASIIYYSNIIAKYPETKIAQASQKRLDLLIKKEKIKDPEPKVAICEEPMPDPDSSEPELTPDSTKDRKGKDR